jgi:tetratricopeptide (TPR) repeat protein
MADQNRPDLAEDFLRRARQIDPVYPEIYMARGEIELRRAFSEGDPERRTTLLESAYEALVTAIRLAPDDMRVEEQLVRIDLYRNRPDAALERAADIVRRNPRNPMLLYLMATVQAHRGGDARAAVARMRQALELDPGNSLIRFSLEEAVLAHTGQFPATGALRRGLAAYHFQRARYYDSIQRRDLTGHHVRRALLLYPFHEAALRLELERYRRTGDYELFIRTLQRLRRTNPDDLKLRHRLELSLREKNNSLAFRAGLFHAESNPDQANYERTPLRVFVFDFRPLEAFPAHPDGPDRFARALAFELERGGPVKAVPADVRETVLGRIRALETNAGRYSYGTYYEPGYINLIDEERQTRSQDVTHIVSGHYRSLGEGFEITYELTEQSTGSLVSRFTLTASGRDALAELSVRAADRINRLLGARGRVIRVRPNQIFVNLGEIDGLKKGTILNVYRLGAWRGRLIVAESATYIARCEPQNTSWDRLDPGDVVVPIRK